MRFTRILFNSFEKSKPFRPENFDVRKVIQFLSTKRDYTLKGIINSLNVDESEMVNIVNQFSRNKYIKYGPELYSAYFTCFILGKARLAGSNKWIVFDNKRNENILPEAYLNVKIEGLDFTGTILNYKGLENIEGCLDLRTLLLPKCQFVDDWCLSTISGLFSETLETLDLSDNSKITDYGLIKLGHLKNLKKLNLSNLKQCKNIEYLCAELELENPNLEITGVDFRSDDAIARLAKKSQDSAEATKKEFEKLDVNKKTFHEYFKKRAEFIRGNQF